MSRATSRGHARPTSALMRACVLICFCLHLNLCEDTPAPYFLPALLPFSASRSSEQPHGWCFLRIPRTTSPQSCASAAPLQVRGCGDGAPGRRRAPGPRAPHAAPFHPHFPQGPFHSPVGSLRAGRAREGPVTSRLLTDLHRVTLGGEVGLGEFLPVRGWASSTCFPVWPLSGPQPQHLQLEGTPRRGRGTLPASRHSSAPATQDR